MKRCYLVTGPESAGNRLLAASLVAAGCEGLGATFQPYHDRLPTTEKNAVVIRSMPHGHDWPDLIGICAELEGRGYRVHVLVTARDHHCMIDSQVETHGHPEETAVSNAARAYREIFDALAIVDADYTVVPYESLVLHPKAARERLLARLGLPLRVPETLRVEGVHGPIEDGNAKHYEAAVA